MGRTMGTPATRASSGGNQTWVGQKGAMRMRRQDVIAAISTTLPTKGNGGNA